MQPIPPRETLRDRDRRLTATAATALQAHSRLTARKRRARRALGSALIAAGLKLAPGDPAPRPH